MRSMKNTIPVAAFLGLLASTAWGDLTGLSDHDHWPLLEEASSARQAIVAAGEGARDMPAVAVAPLGFGPTLEPFLRDYPCESIEACKVPNTVAIDIALTTFLYHVPLRLGIIEASQAPYRDLAEKIKALGLQRGAEGSNFRKFCLEMADRLAEGGSAQPDFARARTLVGEDSPVAAQLRQAQSLIRQFSERIDNEPDPLVRDALRLKLAQEYSGAYKALERLEMRLQWVKSFLMESAGWDTAQGAFRTFRFPLKGYVTYEDDGRVTCTAPESVSPVKRDNFYAALSLFEDWRMVKGMLDGMEEAPRPMTVRCPKSAEDRPVFRYDPQTNTLVNEWKNITSTGWPFLYSESPNEWFRRHTRYGGAAKGYLEVVLFLEEIFGKPDNPGEKP